MFLSLTRYFLILSEGALSLYPKIIRMQPSSGKRTPHDGRINWGWQKERIRNWVRAQAYPYPGAFTFYEGLDEKVVIDEVAFSD